MVMNDLCVLGEMIDGDLKRDAIHMAIAPVVADERLAPGQDVGFVDSANLDRVGQSSDPIGIVDPFLKNLVFRDQKFWLLLYPNTITSLRHDWSHPAFKDPEIVVVDNARKYESEEWLRRFALEHIADYHSMIEGARSGNGYCFGSDSGKQFFDGNDGNDGDVYEFWKHVENATGERFSRGHEENTYFSCGC